MVEYYGMLENTPGYRQILGGLEAATRSRMASPAAKEDVPVSIPVVVHVLHKKATEKIGLAQIQSQIDVINRDFNASNADISEVPAPWKGDVGNAKLKFVLATVAPDGSASNGVVFKKTTKAEFLQNNDMKFDNRGGSDAWPTDRYLNIWVCSLGGGLLGYAQFPGGPAATDGVVILNTAFGTSGIAAAPFNLGRTTTHEIGHWLNLRHIWGDTEDCSGTDFVTDTPNQQFPNRGKPTFPKLSCSNGPHGDMFINYMDYVDDAAMVMFTREQVIRMRAALELLRAGFKTHGKKLTS
jgi:hypothetical protein